MNRIPVHRPKLPTRELIAPYLEQIDRERWYSNFGPLVAKFENKLADHFGVTNKMLTTAVNGTLMLVSIIKALNIPDNKLCIMPSWTFVATAASACYAGLTPYFVDVDKTSQALDPVKLKQQLKSITHPVGCVMIVAPFGAPIDRARWDEFSDETGIPVIIDAAAAFDAVSNLSQMSIGKSPMMISLHATKSFGIGEGALVLSKNIKLINDIKLNTNFGFNSNREALTIGYNAKLSEYAAAVGLAAFDNWELTYNSWKSVRDTYIEELTRIGVEHWFSSDWVASTCNIIIPDKAEFVSRYLNEAGIDTRRWWHNGCHHQQAYQAFPREKKLETTEWLSRSVLGLPFAVDLEPKIIKYICTTLNLMLNESEITSLNANEFYHN